MTNFMKRKISYVDNVGRRHTMRVDPREISCVAYSVENLTQPALRGRNLCKLTYWETYKGISVASKSIICQCSPYLVGRTFAIGELDRMAISEAQLRKMIG